MIRIPYTLYQNFIKSALGDLLSDNNMTFVEDSEIAKAPLEFSYFVREIGKV